jgi:hypothetical protein
LPIRALELDDGRGTIQLRETPGNLSGSGSETHQHFWPTGATCCQSLLLDPAATIGIGLHKWLFLLVTGRGEYAQVFPYHGCALPTELGERLCSRYQQVTTGKVRHMGVGGALTSWHADDRSAAGTRRRPQSRAAGPRRPRRGPSGLGADLRRSLSPVRLRLAGGTEHAAWQGLFEIVALTGTLSQDRGHLHLAVAPGGRRPPGPHPRRHLAEGCTVRTTRRPGRRRPAGVCREHDPATGYDELVVRECDP